MEWDDWDECLGLHVWDGVYGKNAWDRSGDCFGWISLDTWNCMNGMHGMGCFGCMVWDAWD